MCLPVRSPLRVSLKVDLHALVAQQPRSLVIRTLGFNISSLAASFGITLMSLSYFPLLPY
jgi:hypothetical protein